MNNNPKAEFIEVRWSNGRIERATAEAAEEIMKWWRGCEQFASIHGMRYEGPFFEVVQEGKK